MPSPTSMRCTRPCSSSLSTIRYTLARPIVRPLAVSAAWISCAPRQHGCEARYSRTADPAAPGRYPARWRFARASSTQFTRQRITRIVIVSPEHENRSRNLPRRWACGARHRLRQLDRFLERRYDRRRSLLPARLRGGGSRWHLCPCPKSHPDRRRAARRRADGEGGRRAPAGRRRPLPVARVPARVEKAVQAASGKRVDVLEGITLRSGVGDEAGKSDPHVWLDPVLYARIVRRIGAVLGRPEAAKTLAARVKALDGEYRRGLAHCARREFVTSHAAFGYLAARYGLDQRAIT